MACPPVAPLFAHVPMKVRFLNALRFAHLPAVAGACRAAPDCHPRKEHLGLTLTNTEWR